MDPIKLSFNVDGDNFTAAGEASTEMKRALKRMGIDSDAIRKASICMYEGEINMVIHATGGEAEVELNGDSIIITLTDHGPGIADLNQALQEGYSTASQEIRDLGFGAGMGLPNMKRYADVFEIESEVGVGTLVKMTIKH